MRKLIITAIALLLGITTTQALRAETRARITTEYGSTGSTGRCTDNVQATSPAKGARAKERQDQLFPSYWRNEQTGDWEIAFFDNCAIYRSKYWTYKQREAKGKAAEARLLLANGEEELPVYVGKDKKGKRTLQIGGRKVVCSRIASRHLPEYPVKDTRTEFVNSGYRHDTVTVTGWIKDIPENCSQEKAVTFTYKDLFLEIPQTIKAELDGQGRFTAKLPVLNSTEFQCKWADKAMNTLIEPGNTYFLLYAPQEERCYFMGDDVRLQNELLCYPFHNTFERKPWEVDLIDYIDIVGKRLKAQTDSIDILCQAHPSLSTRFGIYSKGNALWGQAYCMAHAMSHNRYHGDGGLHAQKSRKYINETFWPNLPEQLTLHGNVCSFFHECIWDLWTDMRPAPSDFNVQEHIQECAANDEELALLTRWSAFAGKRDSLIKAAGTKEKGELAGAKLDKENRDMLDKVQKILEGDRVRQVRQDAAFHAELQATRRLLDTLPASPLIKEIGLCELAYKEIVNTYAPLSPKNMEALKAWSGANIYISRIEELNDYFANLAERKFDKQSLKSSDTLEGITDGKALLQKILEQFKGKFVLLDVWGTWCGPCRGALEKSAEEYERLSQFDIAYVYLANKSPKNAWENIIKAYNVSGENVAHYNLPPEQQEAIEQYLNVQWFPTYKLFDREGNMLDMKVDARQLEELASILQKLSEQ